MLMRINVSRSSLTVVRTTVVYTTVVHICKDMYNYHCVTSHNVVSFSLLRQGSSLLPSEMEVD